MLNIQANIKEYGQDHYIIEAEELQYLLWAKADHIRASIEKGVFSDPEDAEEMAKEYDNEGFAILHKRRAQKEVV